MTQMVTIEEAEAQRMHAMLQQIKKDVGQLEVMLALLRPSPQPPAEQDIFAEMAGVTANAPSADDSRQAIYTRMPGE